MQTPQASLTQKYYLIGENSCLFQSVHPSVVRTMMQMGTMHHFEKGEQIYSPTSFQERIGLLLEGLASVEKGQGSVLLHTLIPGSWFGVATLFSQSKHYVSAVRAKRCCTVLFFTASDITQMFTTEPIIAKNYLCFLSSRIHFLNHKIDQFTAVSADEKVRLYLLEQVEHCNPIKLRISYSQLAEMLDLSRSSLYRAIERLEDCGLLKKEGRMIHILKPDDLEQWNSSINQKGDIV